MNTLPTYVTSLLRLVGGIVAGWLIGKGYFTEQEATQVGGAALAILAALWSVYSKLKSNTALKNAIDAPAGKAK